MAYAFNTPGSHLPHAPHYEPGLADVAPPPPPPSRLGEPDYGDDWPYHYHGGPLDGRKAWPPILEQINIPFKQGGSYHVAIYLGDEDGYKFVQVVPESTRW